MKKNEISKLELDMALYIYLKNRTVRYTNLYSKITMGSPVNISIDFSLQNIQEHSLYSRSLDSPFLFKSDQLGIPVDDAI